MAQGANWADVGLEYLPGVARRLLHCRDLGEPFDFLTWFEFAPEHTDAFDQLLGRMRASKEWDYVEREVEVRLERDDAAQTRTLAPPTQTHACKA